jgi:hypothetical protein
MRVAGDGCLYGCGTDGGVVHRVPSNCWVASRTAPKRQLDLWWEVMMLRKERGWDVAEADGADTQEHW